MLISGCVQNICRSLINVAISEAKGAVKMGLAYFTNGISPKKWWYVVYFMSSLALCFAQFLNLDKQGLYSGYYMAITSRDLDYIGRQKLD